MQVITIESEAFKKLQEQIDKITTQLENHIPFKEKWFDNQDLCQQLNVSKRTLQSYREQKMIAYSQVGSKIWYRGRDIEKFLSENRRYQTKEPDKKK